MSQIVTLVTTNYFLFRNMETIWTIRNIIVKSGLWSRQFLQGKDKGRIFEAKAEAEISRPRQGNLVPRRGRDQGKMSQGT